jgi:Ohr subfamily peroxiredoxin
MTLYQTTVEVTGGRDGKAKSHDGLLDVGLSLPKELGGKGTATNPEQLFAAGYAACFESALRHVANHEKVKIGDTKVNATVGIGPRADGGFKLAVELVVSVSGIDPHIAEDLVQKAHFVCPYSHATKGNIDVSISLA